MKRDYEIVCYRVMWYSEILCQWNSSDFHNEEFAIEMLKDCLKCGYKCKMLKIMGLVGDV